MKTEQPASIFRRVAAFFYDSLLLTAVFFLITAIAVGLNGGEAIRNPIYLAVLLPIACLFFCWFWMKGGQTLGMQAWKIKLVNEAGGSPTIKASVIRFAIGLLFLPLVLVPAIFDKNKRGLHDRLAGTKILSLKRS